MSNVVDQFARFPTDESEATAENVYRYLLVCAQITYLSRIAPHTKPGPSDPEQHMAGISVFVAEWSTLHLMRHLLGHKYPEGFRQAETPDQVAADMWAGWDDGGDMAPALYEWLEEAGFDPEAIEAAYNAAVTAAAVSG